MFDNLSDLSPAYVINLSRSKDRKSYIEDHFSQYKISDYQFFTAVDSSDILSIPNFPLMEGNSLSENACAYSHLLTIKHWLSTSDSPHAFIFEDDVSFDLSNYWSHHWSYIFKIIPPNFPILQMSTSRLSWPDNYFSFRFHDPNYDWGAIAYLISRPYAQSIIDNHFLNDTLISLNLSEIMLYFSHHSMTAPLLSWNQTIPSTMNDRKYDHSQFHAYSIEAIHSYWHDPLSRKFF